MRSGFAALALTGSLALTSGAFAADLPVPAAAPVFTWSGWYIGGNVGWGWGPDNVRISPSSDATSIAFFTPAFAAGAMPSRLGHREDGIFGGLQAGFNWQTGLLVLGIEVDAQLADINNSEDVVTTGVPGFVTNFSGARQLLDRFATFRGRVGVATGPVLFYVTGGGAVGHIQYDYYNMFPATSDTQTLTASETRWGWTAGGGIEWSFATNWSVKGEYLFMDLGDGNVFTTLGAGRVPNPTTSLRVAFDDDQFHLVRFGVNYRFAPLP
jgi:outer membrane immunogenic protein